MNIRIQGSRELLTPAIEEYVNKRIIPLSKLVKDDVLCEVELQKTTDHHRSGDIFRAEVNMIVSGKQVFVASEKPDLYEAIDDMRNELDRTLSVQKEKKISAFRRGAQKIKNILKGFKGN